MLTQSVLKNIVPSIFYEHLTRSPKIDHFVQGAGAKCGDISRMARPIKRKFSTDIYLGEFCLP
jgi:hypothetical protein